MQLIDQVGTGKAIWASDYPHPESTLGYSAQTVRDIFTAVGEETGRKIVGGTAIDLWNLS